MRDFIAQWIVYQGHASSNVVRHEVSPTCRGAPDRTPYLFQCLHMSFCCPSFVRGHRLFQKMVAVSTLEFLSGSGIGTANLRPNLYYQDHP